MGIRGILDDIAEKCEKVVYGSHLLVLATTYDIYVDVPNVVYNILYFKMLEGVVADLLEGGRMCTHLWLVLDNFWTVKDFAAKSTQGDSCDSPHLRDRNVKFAFDQMCDMT